MLASVRVPSAAVAARMLVAFEHREVHNPERPPAVRHQTPVLPELLAQGADGLVHHTDLVGTEEDQVPILCAGALHDACDRLIRKELQDW